MTETIYKKFYEKLMAVYRSDESDIEKRIIIYNHCIIEWQDTLSKEELDQRSEPKKRNLGDDGKVKQECIPDFAKCVKKRKID